MRPYFAMFAAYNRWANERLYAAVANLSEADYRADRGAFFGSPHGTLNHLLVTDRIWLRRLSGEGPTYDRLDAIVHEDLPALTEARRAEDRRIVDYIDGLTDEEMAGTFTFRPVSDPREITQTRTSSLAHLFNHQTHHRGQVHTLLSMAGGRAAAPILDLLYFQRESGIGMPK